VLFRVRTHQQFALGLVRFRIRLDILPHLVQVDWPVGQPVESSVISVIVILKEIFFNKGIPCRNMIVTKILAITGIALRLLSWTSIS